MRVASVATVLLCLIGAAAPRTSGLAHATPAAPAAPTAAPVTSDRTATIAAVTGTAIPAAMLLGGWAVARSRDSNDNGTPEAIAYVGAGLLVLTPSAGHWYADTAFTTGMAARAGGMALGGLGLLGYKLCDGEGLDCHGWRAATVAGLVLVAGGAVLDITRAGPHARRERRRTTLTMAPVVLEHGAAWSIAGRF